MTRPKPPAGLLCLPTPRSQTRHHDRRLPQISSADLPSRCTHQRSLGFPIGRPRLRRTALQVHVLCAGRSVGQSAGRYALTTGYAMRLNALPCRQSCCSIPLDDPLALLARQPARPALHCIEHRESYPTSHVLCPTAHVVLCTLLALAGRLGWNTLKLQDRPVNILSRRTRDRRLSEAWSSATSTPTEPTRLAPIQIQTGTTACAGSCRPADRV